MMTTVAKSGGGRKKICKPQKREFTHGGGETKVDENVRSSLDYGTINSDCGLRKIDDVAKMSGNF